MTAYRLKLNCTFTLPNEHYTLKEGLHEYIFYKKGLIVIKERMR